MLQIRHARLSERYDQAPHDLARKLTRSLDFRPDQVLIWSVLASGSIYIAGTEEGALHACSCSYSEQYLRTYVGHTGPVYQAHWSPFAPNLFLTASDDWTIRLWAEDQVRRAILWDCSTLLSESLGECCS